MWCNTQVSHSVSLNNARSESELESNPLDPRNMVGSSKRFTHPATYDFSLATYATFDGGESWTEGPPLSLLGDPDPNKVWAGVSDPAIAWDDHGNCYLVALPFPGHGSPYETLGIAVYRSSDGGRTWSAPNFIHRSTGDDKQWATGDRTSTSPYYGRVYAAWDNGSGLAFARTTDRGATWRGVGNQPVGTSLAGGSFAPTIAVGPAGSVYIVWITGSTINCLTSRDGGETFTPSPAVASGITTLRSVLPAPGGFPELPGGKFRVLTLPIVAAGQAGVVVVAWADYRDGVSRIYYRRSADGGQSWLGNNKGQPLLPAWRTAPNQHDFHPQLAARPSGEIACAFYELGPKWAGAPSWINVLMATSHDGGATFSELERVSNVPWDPAVDAPLSHGDPRTTFIGEYFGLAANARGFFPFWTDTRTGIQEIFSGRRMSVGPWTGVQFRGRVPAHATHRWFTFHWPACWHVAWLVIPTTPRRGAPQIRWRVQVERASSGFLTYWISITNLTDRDVDIEARYVVLAAD